MIPVVCLLSADPSARTTRENKADTMKFPLGTGRSRNHTLLSPKAGRTGALIFEPAPVKVDVGEDITGVEGELTREAGSLNELTRPPWTGPC